LDSAGLVPWFSKRSAAAAERGTKVHRLTQLFDEGVLDNYDYPKEYEAYVQSWANFTLDSGFEFEGVELICYDREQGLYCGTIDRFGYDENGERTVWDLFTGVGHSPHKAVQIFGYRSLLAQIRPEYANAKREILRVLPDGVTRIPCKNDVADGGAWVSSLNLYWWKCNYAPNLIEK